MYYMTVIQVFSDGSPTAKAIYDYNSTMFSSLANENLSEVTCLIMDSECIAKKYERWTRS